MHFSASVVIAMVLALAQPSLQAQCFHEALQGTISKTGGPGILFTVKEAKTKWSVDQAKKICDDKFKGELGRSCYSNDKDYVCGNQGTGEFLLTFSTPVSGEGACSADDVIRAWARDAGDKTLKCT